LRKGEIIKTTPSEMVLIIRGENEVEKSYVGSD
jgi:hypothetical protein